jgi:hypothetical protein
MATNGAKPDAGESSQSSSARYANGDSKKAVARVNPPVAKPTRKDIDATFSRFGALIHASNRPLPNRFGDGREPTKQDDKQTGILEDLEALRKGGFLIESAQTLRMALKSAKKGGPVDDKTMIVSMSQFLPYGQIANNST